MIHSVEIHVAEVPMIRSFDHAGAKRVTTASVLVTVDVDGIRGYGEGAPRPYVTGETVGSVVAALAGLDVALLAEVLDWRSFESAASSLGRLDVSRLLGGAAPAPSAAAALETALLDAVCRHHGRPLRDALLVLDIPAEMRRDDGPIPVSLVLDLSRDEAELRELLAHRPRHVKVKATKDIGECLGRIELVRELTAATVSVDVNGAWTAEQLAAAAPSLRALGIAWIEEPTTARDWGVLRHFRHSTGLDVMVDESFVDEQDLRLAVEFEAAGYVNIRVSKCGGVLRSAQLAVQAHGAGLGYQLGVHVGETGPLWGAGRALASVLDAVTVEAGRPDEWFAEPLTVPAFAVDRRNNEVEPLTGNGTGVVPAAALLRHMRKVRSWDAGAGKWTDW
ncbi:enolase C-terminal domain-like protein [Kutzneria buriramensis]|uniref:L-alanine-DL-glutamate epimerase-like enolase superfamily enzyme n=1 Tax=Kutzneria buriramensis TaxID=1045776 RepID=A0A3E0G688_9PSEU|nr:enolase C-terminal domain-like protein [Kutzneria buriramensis]REH18155.1 L-alanine-DL-glutamate epimerase-like enolase superfamily enzyme [Kutzneria buriramensis]